MKSRLTLILLTLTLLMNVKIGFSQVLISTGTGTPDESAMLEIKSTDKGLLIPRLSSNQRTGIPSPKEGLLVFDTDSSSFFIYGKQYPLQATAGWYDISKGAGIWSRNGNNVYLTDKSYNVGIGTSTPTNKLVIKAESLSDTLLEILDQNGLPLMIVTPSLTKFNIIKGNEKNKATAGGFAVGRYSLAKATVQDSNLFVVTPDSTRVYTGTAGGFGVGRYSLAKGSKAKFFFTNMDSTRIYTDGSGVKGTAGGFAVGRYSLAKGAKAVKGISYMYMQPDNYFIGDSSGYNIQTGGGSGEFNTFFGYRTGYWNALGARNVLLGYEAGMNITDGSDNVLLGYNAGHDVTTAGNNISIGSNAGYNNKDNSDNIFIGRYAGYNHIGTGTPNEANNNIFIGYYAGFGIDGGEGKNNICIGTNSGDSLKTGSYNVFLGYQTGRHTRDGDYNTFIGYQTGYQSTGDANSFLGNKSGYNNTAGSGNTFMGNSTGFQNQNGNHNSFYGSNAGQNNQSGSDNTAMGYFAAERSGGAKNTSIGAYAGYHISAGEKNTFIGAETAYQSSSVNTEHNGCVFIGYAAGANLSFGDRDNKLIIDNDGYTSNGYYKYPLIYGEFDNKLLRINGTLTINQDGNDFTFPNSRGSNGNVLISDGTGGTSWGVPSSTAISARNGLSMSGSYVELGGSSLYKNTSINLNSYSLGLTTSSGDAVFSIEADNDNDNENDNPELKFSQDGGAVIGKLGFEGNTPGTLFTGSLWNTFYMVTESDLPLQLGTNNTARLTILNTGNVGIGTTSPSAKLDVSGVVRATGSTWPTTGAGVEIAYNGSIGMIQSYDRDAGTWKPLYLGNSNVGIGTTAPNSKFHVNSASGENAMRVQIAGSTRLLVSSNGGVSVGYNATPPTNGLLVNGNANPRITATYDLGTSSLRWNNVYATYWSKSHAKSYSNQVLSQTILLNPIKESKSNIGFIEVSSLPIELTKDNSILTGEMSVYNYQLNYEQQVQINKQQSEIEQLKQQIQELKDLIQNK